MCLFPILDMLPHSGDIRDQTLKWYKIDQNYARFWPQIFPEESLPNFWRGIIKSAFMWQSFTAIGQGTSENAWLNKEEENVCGKT